MESVGLQEVSINDLFINPKAVAAGSIATLHRGLTAQGETVAVKIIRKGVQDEVARDAAVIRKMLPLAQLVARRLPLRPVLMPLINAAETQTSMLKEAQALEALYTLFADDDHVIVPQPNIAASSDTILVMTYLFEAEIGHDASGTDETARTMLEVVFKMIFWGGLIHCDLHPGNLLITATKRVVLLDAGFTITLSAASRRLFADFFIGLALGRWDDCAMAVTDALIAPNQVNLAEFYTEIIRVMAVNDLRNASDFSISKLAVDLFAVQKRFSAFTRPEFTFPILSLLTVEGRVRAMSPHLSIASVAIPIIIDERSLTGMRELT